MRVWSTVTNALTEHGACALITQLEVEGSAPRDAGVRMVVMPDGTFTGTIGGGALEWHLQARAQKLLRSGQGSVDITRHALGPEMGQCCGGAVRLMVEVWTASRLGEAKALAIAEAAGPFVCEGAVENSVVRRVICKEDGPSGSQAIRFTERFGEQLRQVFLFGAGHVGRALVLALAPLPFEVVWVDERLQEFPAAVPGNVTMVASRNPAAELEAARDGAFVLAMTHSHACDLDIVHTALQAGRFGYVGVIGSKTKRARFVSRLRKANIDEESLASLVCPIGMPGISSKAPAAIAAVVAVQLLQRDELVKTGQKPVHCPVMEVKLHETG